MSTIISEEQIALLRPGQLVRVRKDDDYFVRGHLLGLEHTPDGAKVRVLPDDKVERKVPLPARVILDV